MDPLSDVECEEVDSEMMMLGRTRSKVANLRKFRASGISEKLASTTPFWPGYLPIESRYVESI